MNRNVRIKKKLNKSKINNSHLESFVSNPNKSFQNRSFTYQQQDEFEPGSWEWNSQYNNIYYSNQGGAVSVNTKNIQYFDPYSKYPELNPNLNGYKKQNSTFGSQVINANNAPEITPGKINGKVIFIKVLTGLLPRLAAALVTL